MKSTVSERGQVTIPKSLRDRLGLVPGTHLEFSAEGGRLVAVKREATDAVDAVYGILDLPDGTDAMVEQMRGPAT